jgi:hypothetical protein
VYESGEPGTPECVYRLYLFDIKMNSGKNFNLVRAAFFDGTNKGIADTVTSTDPSTGETIVQLIDTAFDTVVFNSGLSAIGNTGITGTNYSYRTTSETETVTIDGRVIITGLSSGETFAYTAGQNLTTTQKEDIILVPQATINAAANISGTVTTAGTTALTGSSTQFASELNAGDYIRIRYDGSSNTEIRRIVTINSATSLTLDANTSYSAGANVAKVFPAFVPIPLSSRSNRTVNVDSVGTTMTIDLFSTTAEQTSGSAAATVTYNVKKSSVSAVAKSVFRGALAKIDTSSHSATTSGPWCLGMGDIVRLKGVYMNTVANIATMNTTNSQDITKNFFINDGQTKDYYGLGYLVKTGNIGLSGKALLVEFDVFTHGSEGLKTFNSYAINDTLDLASSNSTINTSEIPEFKDQDNTYYDLRDSFDFRPLASNTVVRTSNTTLANTNPSNTVTLSASDKLLPVPDSTVTFNAEFYLPRIDTVFLTKEGNIVLREGTPSIRPLAPKTPANSLTLSQVFVTPYPSYTIIPSSRITTFLNKRIGQSSVINSRYPRYKLFVVPNAIGNKGQFRRYTMADIGKLERRIQSLEYYASLNLVEKSIKDLIIPSSVTPTLNRFKNGFIVDSFQDYLNCETSSNEFRAFVDQEQTLLKPYSKVFNIECEFNTNDSNTLNNIKNSMLLLPYTEEELDQNNKIATSTVGSIGIQTAFVGIAISEPRFFRVHARTVEMKNNIVVPVVEAISNVNRFDSSTAEPGPGTGQLSGINLEPVGSAGSQGESNDAGGPIGGTPGNDPVNEGVF